VNVRQGTERKLVKLNFLVVKLAQYIVCKVYILGPYTRVINLLLVWQSSTDKVLDDVIIYLIQLETVLIFFGKFDNNINFQKKANFSIRYLIIFYFIFNFYTRRFIVY